MSNKEKFHKLGYDYAKSFAFSSVTLLFVCILSYNNPYIPPKVKSSLNLAIIIFLIVFLISITWMAFSFGVLVKIYGNKKVRKENWFKERFNVSRFFKAFLLSVTIGLGAYLGKIFFATHWLLALTFITLFLMIFAGNLLDALYPGYR